MKLTALAIAGVYRVELETQPDERGWFARSFERSTFLTAGLVADYEQESLAFNHLRGCLRGLHYQTAPHAETKIVRCVRGAIYDVVVDLREQSATYGAWLGVELDENIRSALYIPAGCAHGYQTLSEGSEVSYRISVPYSAAHTRGIRWNDPRLAIAWPLGVSAISARDAALPALAARLVR